MNEQTNSAAIGAIVIDARDQHGWSLTVKASNGGDAPTYELRREKGGYVEEVCIVVNNRKQDPASGIEIVSERHCRERWIINPNSEEQRRRIRGHLCGRFAAPERFAQ